TGGVSAYGNRTTNKTYPANVTEIGHEETNSTLPDDINETGSEETNETLPMDANRTGGRSNQTIARNANKTGATGNQTVPGNASDQPGSVPRPIIEVEPVNRTYTAARGQYTPVNLSIMNKGNISVGDIRLRPEFGDLGEGWNYTAASINNLTVGEKVTRDIHVKPPDDAEARRYTIPVIAEKNGYALDIDYFYLEVTEEPVFAPELEILEAPSSIQVTENKEQPLPVLVKNTGGTTLHNITGEMQNIGDCGTIDIQGVKKLEVNETASVSMTFTPENTEKCTTTLIVSSAEGAYSFSEMDITVVPEEGLIPPRQQPPLLAIIWTLILVAYSLGRKRFMPESGAAKIPLVLMVMGEATILLYLVVNHYGLVAAPFLPF
ncbi:MAG: NEW3 domain-containing protein, partial [Candidatus Nanohaloarchaea archaeon]|nr:NEW3 domain-containing protein [Candidatus Nanohaloarchaea archaeon]